VEISPEPRSSGLTRTFWKVTPSRGRSSPGVLWAAAVSTWSVVFAAPHFYWALGGRAGLAGQAAAADVALQQSWFAAYNLVAGCLAILGAMVAAVLTLGWGGRRVRRCLLIATAAASVVLLVRGLLGVTLLGVSLVGGTFDEQTPTILLAIEPWFLLGGLAYGGLTLHQRPGMNTPSS
jgi:Protein of unknown function (DUF3995)